MRQRQIPPAGGEEGVVSKPAVLLLLLQRPLKIAPRGPFVLFIWNQPINSQQTPRRARVVGVHERFGFRARSAPRSVGRLRADQPIAGAFGGVQITLIQSFDVGAAQTENHLAGVEDYWLGVTLPSAIEPALRRARRQLDLQLPIGHATGAVAEFIARSQSRVIEERWDDVAGRFRIGRMPTVYD